MSEDPYIIVGTDTARRLVKPSKRRWLLSTVGGAILLIAAVVTSATLLTSSTVPTIPVKKGDIIWSYVASGRVEPETTLDIIPKQMVVIEAIHVKEGDEVRKGQLLVTLRDLTLPASYQSKLRSREETLEEWNRIKRGTRPELIEQASAKVKEAEAILRGAEAERNRIYRGSRPEEKKQAEAELSRAKAELKFAQEEWNRIQKLGNDQVVTQREIEEAARRLETAKAKVDQATAKRNQVVRGATEEEKERADADVAGANAKVQQAKADLALRRKGATEEEKKVAEARVKRAEAEIELIQTKIAQLKVYAPISGIVLRRYKEPGELNSPQTKDPILVLASPEKKFRIEVLEQDIFKVREGQEMEINSDSYPGRTWKATVTRISPVLGKKRLSSENPKQKFDVKVLEVWLTPVEPIELPVNLPVEAHMHKVIRENVLILPARAVDPTGHVYFSREERRKVETGVRDDAFVEIISGVKEGDAIWAP